MEESLSEDDSSQDRIESLGFRPQKILECNRLLPYADKLDEESNRVLATIKANLGRAVMLREICPGCRVWTARLMRFTRLYGLKISKEDHLAFVRMLYELVTLPNLEPYLVNKFASTLLELLSKKYLNYDDLTLDWRPLYEVRKRIIEDSHAELGMYRYFTDLDSTLNALIRESAYYFPPSTTQEVLDLFRPRLCPFDSSTTKGMEGLNLFLPTMRRADVKEQGYTLWLDELMHFWSVCNNSTNFESELMWLLARLARLNIGHIDWEPHMAMMFTRFLRSLNLPVLYKKMYPGRIHKLDSMAICQWIVSTIGGKSSTYQYLEKFMKTLETYLQPANFGRWVLKLRELIKRIVSCFISRVYRERVKKRKWEPPIPESHLLSDEDITKFVEIMQPITMQAMYSKAGVLDMVQSLQYLATLKPSLVVPPIVEKMYMNLDSITEPHKLTTAMMCVVAVGRPMLEQVGDYKEGRGHVLPLLMSVLPGIDPNDSFKCFITFQFISTFATLVPLVDSSRAYEHFKDLTDEEEILCAASSGFEDFVLQFIDRCLSLIESSSIDQSRIEQESDKWESESLTESAILSTVISVLTQTSPSIFQQALRKVNQFVISRILETSVAGILLAVLCQAFAMVNAEETLKLLVPNLCSAIMQGTESEDIIKEPHLNNELLYQLQILAEVVCCDGSYLVQYVPLIMPVLDRTLRFVSKEGQHSAGRLLSHMLDSMVHMKPTDYRSVGYNFTEPLTEHLPVRDWSKPCSIYDLKIIWHIPSREEVQCVQQIVGRYLPPELEKINNFVSGNLTLTRDELQSTLNIMMSILAGRPLLPVWDEEPITLMDSAVDLRTIKYMTGVEGMEVTMPDGSNVRQEVARVMIQLQKKLLRAHEDDTRSFFLLISIYELLLCNQGTSKSDFLNHWKNYSFIKQLLDNKLAVGSKRQLRRMIIDRAVLQQKMRQSEASTSVVTETHKQIFLALLELAASQYSEVRAKAQGSLSMSLEMFTFSYRLLVPQIIDYLKLDSNKFHEQFKGALYVLLGPKQNPLVSKHSWELLSDLWFVLVTAKPSEKNSVIRLMEKLVESVHKNFPTITIQLEVPQKCADTGRALWSSLPIPDQPIPTETELELGKMTLDNLCRNKQEKYTNLVNKLLDAIESGNLHWRYNDMAVSFLRDLVHPDVPFPSRAVKFFLKTLIHDTIHLRKLAIASMVFILQQQKRDHVKVLVDPTSYQEGSGLTILQSEDEAKQVAVKPGDREDNAWLQYNYQSRPLTTEQWQMTRYQHRPYLGYYCWPKKVEVYASYSKQPCLDRPVEEMDEAEADVFKFFHNQANIDKLIEYLSLEEKKGRDKFNSKRYILFKNLFRNHGDAHLNLFLPHLKRLVADKNESSQRCAAEIIAGLIKGAKHWPFDKIESLWRELCPIIRCALSNMTVETVGDWGICFATAAESRDPNQQHWLLEVLMEEPLREEAAFKDCGRLYALQGALNQHEWRIPELLHRLLHYVKPFLTHSFQNVRERLGSVLTNIFNLDIALSDQNLTKSPRIDDFISEVLPRLQILCANGPKDIESKMEVDSPEEVSRTADLIANVELSAENKAPRDLALRLLKTVCQWSSACILRSCFGVKPSFYKFFPIVCLLESYEGDDEISKCCTTFLAYLAFSLNPPSVIPTALATVKSTLNLGSWKARLTCLDFLQVLVFHNMPNFLSNDEWVKDVTSLVLTLMKDERLEVREKASQVLGGLLHCDFISSTDELLKQFTKQSKTKLKRSSALDNIYTESVIKRHCGVLGLCAFIDAYPYEVPDFIPDVFSVLGDHLNDPPPISTTIRKSLGNFKRTHLDNWQNHKLKFSEDQLCLLSDLLIPPTYYA
ncbi:proteasome activator complex subunit 4-like [Neocloeon triangulifer]|uniref:proteasome activator complex subunit 4-like n=1 Tax=Neocloeon triangulifer TaxID=2078957 RepID=UPI00286F7E58|nr:proteasome activator complex subunit 4-like [Neocloeon triangulifer]